MKTLLKNLFPYKIWVRIIFLYQLINFYFFKKYKCRGSIDKQLMHLIKKDKGTYLEVGAYNGLAESVSLRFQVEKNWQGILIEPNTLHFKHLKFFRNKDICINKVCLAPEDIKRKVYLKNLNQMSYIVDEKEKIFSSNDYPEKMILNLSKETKSGNFKLEEVEVTTLNLLSQKYNIFSYDLMIIDVEGSEIALLEGIDFSILEIEFFCIETYNFEVLNTFMKSKKYEFITKLHINDYVFKRIDKI